MTKGGKKRRAPSRSESQDSSRKFIPQFSKKRKCNNDSDENLERTQSNAELLEDEKTLQVTEDDTKTEVIEVAVDNTGEESCGETDTGPSDVTIAKQLSGSNEQHDDGDETLLDTTSLAAVVEDVSLKDAMHTTSPTTISSQAVMVVEMYPEQPEVVAGNMEEKPCLIDASTQVEISDDNTFKQPADNKITSDPLIPALLDELSALNRLVMSCKRELETVRRKRDIWMKNNKAIK